MVIDIIGTATTSPKMKSNSALNLNFFKLVMSPGTWKASLLLVSLVKALVPFWIPATMAKANGSNLNLDTTPNPTYFVYVPTTFYTLT